MTHTPATLDALLLAGAVTGTPGALALAREVQCRELRAWSEMVERLAGAAAPRRTLTWALVQQCDPIWAGCRHPLSRELADRVAALLDAEGLPLDPSRWGLWVSGQLRDPEA